MKKIDNKEPLLYSIVLHDQKNRQIISLSDFVTDCNKTTSISKYLYTIKHILEQPNIIVTDQSWALINASLEIFNRCNINQYLNWCFKNTIAIYYNSDEEKFGLNHKFKTILYICAAHFLKNIIRKVKLLNLRNDDTYNSVRAKKLLIFCFTLLQNSTNIQQFEDLLINIYNIFNNKYYNKRLKYSLFMIRDQLKYRGLNKLKNFDTHDEEQREIDSEESSVIFSSKRENITETSPFKHYFNNKINQYKVTINSLIIKF